jgi:hypothetical protein
MLMVFAALCDGLVVLGGIVLPVYVSRRSRGLRFPCPGYSHDNQAGRQMCSRCGATPASAP